METDLIKFNENVKPYIKNMSIYEDDKGSYKVVATIQTILQCEYVEIEKSKIQMAKFKNIIDFEELPVIEKTIQIDKYSKTKNKKDMGTIIDAQEEFGYCWIVSNQLGVRKTYLDKEEALNYVKLINEKIIESIEV